MVYFDAFFDGRGFAEHQSSLLWSVSQMLITLEPHGIFRSNLDQILHTYLFQYCQATGMQNGDKGMPSIIFASQCI